jgi:hypothetical protein
MSELGSIRDLLRNHGLDGVPEQPFANDGWSGASMTLLRRGGGDRFVLKRDSLAGDWIARATNDGPILREAWFAAHGPALPPGVRSGSLGAGADGVTGEVAILMPDLSHVLFDWDAPISVPHLEQVLSALAELHGFPWRTSGEIGDGPWCPLRERITLICRPSLERAGPAHDAVADRLLPGWDAWDRLATPAACRVIADLAADPQPLLDELAAQPATLIHGDLKLANVGIEAEGSIVLVDWQMVGIAPVAVELGWFLVSNVASLPLPPDEVIRRYQARVRDGAFDSRGVDAAILVGLLLRGWRKGMDAEAGITLASGVSAADDLAWWCERAVEAADRLF